MLTAKQLITLFFLANTLDSASTSYLLTQQGWQELNQFALSMIARGQIHVFLILKIAFMAALISAYAVTKQRGSRLAYPLEKALLLGNLIVWTVQLWNAFNVLLAVT